VFLIGQRFAESNAFSLKSSEGLSPERLAVRDTRSQARSESSFSSEKEDLRLRGSVKKGFSSCFDQRLEILVSPSVLPKCLKFRTVLQDDQSSSLSSSTRFLAYSDLPRT
jgi:hypothetical protein